MDILKVAGVLSKKRDLQVSEVCWYASIPSETEGSSVYKKQRKFLASLEKKGVKVFVRKLQRLSTKNSNRRKKEIIESSVCSLCKPVVGKNFLILENYIYREKGIDVKIAIGMMKAAIMGDADVVVLISGDSDFVPALEFIGEVGKDVLSCSLPSGYSSELRQKFPHLVLSREDLAGCLRNGRCAK